MTTPTAAQLFKIGREDRVTIVGASRSGKSYGAAFLLKEEIKQKGEKVLIIDSKISGVFNDGPWHFISTPAELDDFYLNPANRKKSVCYRPPFETTREQLIEDAETLCRWAYLNGPMTVYIDEIMEVCKSATQFPPSLGGLATRGGERGVRLWVASQRPKGIPMVLISEANHYFIFRLRLDDDKSRISEAAEYNLDSAIGQLKKRQFLYVDSENETITGPYTFI